MSPRGVPRHHPVVHRRPRTPASAPAEDVPERVPNIADNYPDLLETCSPNLRNSIVQALVDLYYTLGRLPDSTEALNLADLSHPRPSAHPADRHHR